MGLLEVFHLSHAFGDKVLYRDAAFTLQKGEHIGVVGQNGAGKSTLIGILTGSILPDAGSICWQPGIRLGYLDQYAAADGARTILEYLKTAFTALYQLEKQVYRLYETYAESGDERLLQQAADGQAKLEVCGFYGVDTQIGRVADGLGLAALGMGRTRSSLSGGQACKGDSCKASAGTARCTAAG